MSAAARSTTTFRRSSTFSGLSFRQASGGSSIESWLRRQPAATPFEAIVHLARGYLRAAETDDELRRIGLGQCRAVLGWEGWREACNELGVGLAIAGATAAIEAGELPPFDPETVAIIMLGTMIEAAMLIVVADDRSAAREKLDAVIVDLLEGLRR